MERPTYSHIKRLSENLLSLSFGAIKWWD